MTNDIRLGRSSATVASVALLLVAALAGCGSGVSVAPAQTTRTATQNAEPPDDTAPPAVAGGSWTGTITLHGVINEDKVEDVTSGDPGSTYYATGTTHDVTKVDVTDSFTLTGNDPEDVTYGISSVDFGGTASNAGSTLERYTQNWNKQNSGCTWKEETGTETAGTWTDSGKTVGSLDLSEDGRYTITIRADVSGPDGSYETPKLPQKTWQHVSDLSAGCTGDTFDTTDTSGPLVWWVADSLGETDVNGKYSEIAGQLSPNPGTTIDGSATWKLENPPMTMDITWHLVHSSPIVLPHD